MVVQSGFSLDDLETLRQATSILRGQSDNAFQFGDLGVLSRAAALLDITIPELPAQLGAENSESSRSRGKQRVVDTTASGVETSQNHAVNTREQSQRPSAASASSFVPDSALVTSSASATFAGAHNETVTQAPIIGSAVNTVESLSGFAPQSDGPVLWDGSGLADATNQDPFANDWGNFDPGIIPVPYDNHNMLPDYGLEQWNDADFDTPIPNGFEDMQLPSTGGNGDAVGAPFRSTPNAQPVSSNMHHIEEFENAPDDDYMPFVQDLSHDSSSGVEGQQRTPSASDDSLPGDRSRHRSLAPKQPNPVTHNTAVIQRPPPKTLLVDSGVRKGRVINRRSACIRCRIFKKKCTPIPTQPHSSICFECDKVKNPLIQVPCLYHKLTDSILFRTGTWNDPFEVDHPMVGKKYGDFYLQRQWVGGDSKVLYIKQDYGLVLAIEVREFVPPDEYVTDDKGLYNGVGRSVYEIPWAVADPDEELQKLNERIDSNLGQYLESILDFTDPLVWKVYQSALRIAQGPNPNVFMRNVFRMWTGMRLLEGGWRCCGEDNLASERVPNELRPADWVSPPSFVDHQFFSIVMHRYLGSYKKKVLKELERLVLTKDQRHWYNVFLACFVLLHSNELLMAWIYRHATKRKAPVKYLYKDLVRAIHSATKTILVHFHYCLKAQIPFQPGFDWNSPGARRMAALDQDQLDFMEDYTRVVHQKTEEFRAVRHSHAYDSKYWFVSQLFEQDWEPRDTLEHAPPA